MTKFRSFRHGEKRVNNPTGEMVDTSDATARGPSMHDTEIRESDRSIIPTIEWDRKPDGDPIPAPILNTVEKIEPASWLESLSRNEGQQDLFASFDRYANPNLAKVQWYEHTGDWQNRLIHADARRAMASLLENEHMASTVQCVYFDPPYGMDFDARFTDDTVQVTAFRDSYENGIHSYLDGIRGTALLARELMKESGSFFMQIGEINVHRCAMVLDEVFGPENRVSTIMFATAGGAAAKRKISRAGDYILWYAKNLQEMQYQELYEEQNIEEWCDSQTFAGGG